MKRYKLNPKLVTVIPVRYRLKNSVSALMIQALTPSSDSRKLSLSLRKREGFCTDLDRL